MSTLKKTLVAAVWIACAATTAQAAGFMDNLKDAATSKIGSGSGTSSSMLGGLGLPAIGGSTASNAAGVLQYCIQNKYAKGAQNVKDALLSKVGLGAKPEQDAGYQSGLQGLLTGSDGSTFNLDKLKSNLKEKACDYVLDNAKSLI